MSAKAARIPPLLFEALAVAGAGVVLALAANAVSPRGISLSAPVKPVNFASVARSPASASGPSAGRIAGFETLSREQVLVLHADLRRSTGQFVFIDARGEHHYREARIPGALSLDPYNPATHLEAVGAAVAGAERVIIYCNGEQCADSRLAAELIVGLGVPPERIALYAGGIKDWIEARQPVEQIVRKSDER